MPSDAQYIKAAKAKHECEGSVEFDDTPEISKEEDGGAYVHAWVWVYDDEALDA